jgi:hypothetical protein
MGVSLLACRPAPRELLVRFPISDRRPRQHLERPFPLPASDRTRWPVRLIYDEDSARQSVMCEANGCLDRNAVGPKCGMIPSALSGTFPSRCSTSCFTCGDRPPA